MKRELCWLLACLILSCPAVWATDETPPLAVEVKDDCSGDAENLGFMVREKIRASHTFKLTSSSSPHMRMRMTAMSSGGTIAVSLVWTLVTKAGENEEFIAHGLLTVGSGKIADLPDNILADTEKAFQTMHIDFVPDAPDAPGNPSVKPHP